MNQPFLEVTGISKRFGGVKALQSVDIAAYQGEVLGLVGENGAGKSTLVKILTGIYAPDEGTIHLGGSEPRINSPQDAADAGISAIQQEPSMFDDLTVAENIFVGAQPIRGFFRQVDWRKMRAESRRILEDIGVSIDPLEVMKHLSVAERHMVSLARALSTDANLIIFDEPTAALSQSEIQHLYSIIEGLKTQNKTIIFISHKFDEIFRICDRYTVLRDGQLVGTGLITDVTKDDLIRMMVGRELKEIYPKVTTEISNTVLRVEGFSHPTEFQDISFELRRGEILGFYGLVGAGRTEVMEAIFGLKKISSGRVEIEGQPVQISSPNQAMDAGLAYVPEDRQKHGALLPFSISKNFSLPQIHRVANWVFLNRRGEYALVDRFGEQVHIKASSWSQPVRELSGGNQQKVVIGKWLATNPKVVILDEPTKGVDVGSKAAVHKTIGDLVQKGLSVILVTSEIEEAKGLSDRLIVMNRGKIAAEFERSAFSSESIVAAAAGLTEVEVT